MNIHKTIISGVSIILSLMSLHSCMKEESHITTPEITIEGSIDVGPEADVYEIPLVSSYPWYAEAVSPWVKVTKNRGQALLDEKIVFSVEPNTTLDPREGIIKVRLMDQKELQVIVKQNGRAEYVSLPMEILYFNNQPSEYSMDVLTKIEWDIKTKEENGISFSKSPEGKLLISSTANTSGADRVATTTVYSVANPDRSADLKIVQRNEKDILSFLLSDDQKTGSVVSKGGGDLDFNIATNNRYKMIPSEEWVKITTIPSINNADIVSTLVVSCSVSPNTTGEERSCVIKLEGTENPCGDEITLYQRGVGTIVYCKVGGTGDGTTWERAYGSIVDAMNACDNFGDQELWVSEGVFTVQAPEWIGKKYINVFGGFKGDEIAVGQRDMNRKTTLTGTKKFLWGYRDNSVAEDKYYYMDGFIITGINDPNGNIGLFELYKHHALRNCIICNNTYGKNAGGYFEETRVENCLFYGNTNTGAAGVVQINKTDMVNCTIVGNKATGDWSAAGGVRLSPGSRMISTVVWGNEQQCKRDFSVQVYLDKDKEGEMINCFIMPGFKIKDKTEAMFNDGFAPKGGTGWSKLDKDNSVAAKFCDPAKFDWQLLPGSVLIDAGKDEFVSGIKTDIIGKSRIAGDHVDVGAYEYHQNK